MHRRAAGIVAAAALLALIRPAAAPAGVPTVAFFGFDLINTSLSNLILNINVYMEDTATGKMEFVKSVDIRGNNDESWRRGLDYLLRYYLFREP